MSGDASRDEARFKTGWFVGELVMENVTGKYNTWGMERDIRATGSVVSPGWVEVICNIIGRQMATQVPSEEASCKKIAVSKKLLVIIKRWMACLIACWWLNCCMGLAHLGTPEDQ